MATTNFCGCLKVFESIQDCSGSLWPFCTLLLALASPRVNAAESALRSSLKQERQHVLRGGVPTQVNKVDGILKYHYPMGPDLNLQPKVQWPHRGSLSPGGAKGWTVGAKNGEHKGARRCNAYERKTHKQ